MSSHLHVREAARDDVSDLVRLNGEVQQLHVDARPDDFRVTNNASVGAWLTDQLRDPSTAGWVAEVENVVVGYVLTMTHDRPSNPFCPRRRWCEIDQIAVASTHRGKNIGRALIERAVADARRRGIHDIELSVWAFNTTAQKAFEALGFTPRRQTLELNCQPHPQSETN